MVGVDYAAGWLILGEAEAEESNGRRNDVEPDGVGWDECPLAEDGMVFLDHSDAGMLNNNGVEEVFGLI
jgi:hypothetical protein